MAPLTLLAGEAVADPPDGDLVVRLRDGDRAAASVLYARHVERVRRIVARIVGVGPDLDDLTQDAFLTALRRLGSLRQPEAFGAWLGQVAVGCARHHLRAKARKRWLTFWSPADVPEPAAPPVVVDGARDAARAVAAVLAELPIDERIAFALRRVEGVALEEAAALCGVSLATFKRRLAKAEALFTSRARVHPALGEFFAGGER